MTPGNSHDTVPREDDSYRQGRRIEGDKHICHISTVHAAGSIRILHKECRSLRAHGYTVSYIVQSESDRHSYGIHIVSLPTPKGRFERMVSLALQAYRKAVTLDADIYHFHDPELIPIGLLLKLAAGKKVVYDVHEDLPAQILSKRWIRPGYRKPLAWGINTLEKLSVRAFDAVVAATPAIQAKFPREKVVLVQNYPMMKEFAAADEHDYEKRKPIVSYIGGISALRGAWEMARAVANLPEYLGVELHLAGHAQPESLPEELRSIGGPERIVFHGWLSRTGVAQLLNTSRVGLVLLHPLQNYLESYPVKLFEYMAAGIPVVASDFPLWKKIVEDAGCGLVVDPLQTDKIAGAIQWLLEHPREASEMGRRGRQAVRTVYNWRCEAEKLATLYARLL